MNLLHGMVYIEVPWLAGWLPLPEALTEGRKRENCYHCYSVSKAKRRRGKRKKRKKRERADLLAS